MKKQFNMMGLRSLWAAAGLLSALTATAEERPTPLTPAGLDWGTYTHLDRAERVEVLRAIREFYIRHDSRNSAKLEALRVSARWPSSLQWLQIELFPEAVAADGCAEIKGAPAWVNEKRDCSIAGRLTCIGKVEDRLICGAGDRSLRGACKSDEVQCDSELFPPKGPGPLCARISGRGERNPTHYCDRNSKPLDETSETLNAQSVLERFQRISAYCENKNAWDFNQEDCKVLSQRLAKIQIKPRRVASTVQSTCSRDHLHLCQVRGKPVLADAFEYEIQIDDKTHEIVACSNGSPVAQATLADVLGKRGLGFRPSELTREKLRELFAEIKFHYLTIDLPGGRAKATVEVPLGSDKPAFERPICDTQVEVPLAMKERKEQCSYTKSEYQEALLTMKQALTPSALENLNRPFVPEQIKADCQSGLRFEKAGRQGYLHPWIRYSIEDPASPLTSQAWRTVKGVGYGFTPLTSRPGAWEIYSTPGCGPDADKTAACVLSVGERIHNVGNNGQYSVEKSRRVIDTFLTPGGTPAR